MLWGRLRLPLSAAGEPARRGALPPEITASTATLAGADDLGLPIPSSPGWTLRQLITHVGRVQRWAAEIAAARSAGFIPSRSVPDGRLPDDPAQRPGWLREGAALLIALVSGAGDAAVWALGRKRPAGSGPGH